MDHEVLVSEFRKILKVLKQEQRHVAVFMLKAIEADIRTWNLIISTLEYDQISTKKAVRQVVNILNKTLKKTVLQTIVRVTILKTSDPFVEEITRTFPVKNTVKYIQSSLMGGIYIEKAIVFESRSVPSLSTPKRSPNEIVHI